MVSGRTPCDHVCLFLGGVCLLTVTGLSLAQQNIDDEHVFELIAAVRAVQRTLALQPTVHFPETHLQRMSLAAVEAAAEQYAREHGQRTLAQQQTSAEKKQGPQGSASA